MEGVRIDQAFIGSCANGTLEDLRLAAEVLQGRQVSPKVRLIVTPGSQRVYLDAARDGTIAGWSRPARSLRIPTCGACGGGHVGVLGPRRDLHHCRRSRNFKGRMGDPSSRVYMGSPATVAASALTGVITDPRPYLA